MRRRSGGAAGVVALALIAASCGGAAVEEGAGSGGREGLSSSAAPVEPTVASSPVERSPAAADAPVAAWVSGVNSAGWRYHRTLEGDSVSSPTSIGLAFSFARGGASTGTGEVLDEIFGFPAGEANHEAANAVGLALDAANATTTTVETANRLFTVDGFTLNQDFVDLGARSYGAGVATLPDDPEGKAATVNDWVSEQTRDLIPEIVDPELMKDVVVELVNTVYLKADWRYPFHPELTEDQPFATGAGTEVEVPFLRWEDPVEVPYADLGDAEAVGLPYQDGDLTMWLLVPTDDDGLDAVEASLAAEDIASLGDGASPTMVELALPRWEAELPTANLFAWLCPEGLCAGAPFGGIAAGLALDHAVHGAKIIVDEKGTEAAAATALGFGLSGGPGPDVEVVLDHPFLWALVHEPTNSMVFVGRVVDPS